MRRAHVREHIFKIRLLGHFEAYAKTIRRDALRGHTQNRGTLTGHGDVMYTDYEEIVGAILNHLTLLCKGFRLSVISRNALSRLSKGAFD